MKLRGALRYTAVSLSLLVSIGCGWSTRRTFVQIDDAQTWRTGGCSVSLHLQQESSRQDYWQCAAFLGLVSDTDASCDFGIDSIRVQWADVSLTAAGRYLTLTPDANPVSAMPAHYAPIIEVPRGARKVVCRVFITKPGEENPRQYHDFELAIHEWREPYLGE